MRRRWLAYNNPGGYHRFRFAHQRGRGRGAEHGASVTTTEGTKSEDLTATLSSDNATLGIARRERL